MPFVLELLADVLREFLVVVYEENPHCWSRQCRSHHALKGTVHRRRDVEPRGVAAFWNLSGVRRPLCVWLIDVPTRHSAGIERDDDVECIDRQSASSQSSPVEVAASVRRPGDRK